MATRGPQRLMVDGKQRAFDIDDPRLPRWVKENQLSAGGYPYTERMRRKAYEAQLERLQIELVKLQYWQQDTGKRIVCVFEGRDAAGKGGAIRAMREHLNPRRARIVALPKPSDRERTQWYFQRYVAEMPAGGELVLFDRSWYNRAGVEPVMGFCTEAEHRAFLHEAPAFEAALARDGIHLVKFWLAIGQETQLKRFHDRRHDPLKIWKLSPMDLDALTRWDDYSAARDAMLSATHTVRNPWHIVLMNDKRRGRIALLQTFLSQIDYEGRDLDAIGTADDRILLRADKYLEHRDIGM